MSEFEISSEYDLELERVVSAIKDRNVKRVLIQLPDCLKPLANKIQGFIEEKTNAKVMIWAGSCFGACDTPEVKGVDLLIQWGHSEWL